jgi:hypothetical protein
VQLSADMPQLLLAEAPGADGVESLPLDVLRTVLGPEQLELPVYQHSQGLALPQRTLWLILNSYRHHFNHCSYSLLPGAPFPSAWPSLAQSTQPWDQSSIASLTAGLHPADRSFSPFRSRTRSTSAFDWQSDQGSRPDSSRTSR